MLTRVLAASFLAYASLASAGAAQTRAEIEETSRDAYELAHNFAECAGFWDFMAVAENAAGNPGSSANAHNVGNGARLSAGYLLSVRHRIENPDAAPRAYGSWDDFIEPIAEVTSTRMVAYLEQGASSEIERQASVCAALGQTSQDIIEEMRAERTRQP